MTAHQELEQAGATEQLVMVIQRLSLARDLDTVMSIVRRAARELTGADGATFVLRDGDRCYYADEDAIAPLWKGQRFPMAACISGWTMLNRRSATIEDIYADPRVPHDAYRPTFVKSLAMVPIRTIDPIGAIGNYWATRHRPTGGEIAVLQALADTTAVAIENVRVYAELEQRVRDRTAELEAANRELETFSYAVSHDLRAPLRHIVSFAGLLVHDADTLGAKARRNLDAIQSAAERMGQLIEDLLALSRVTQTTLVREPVDLTATAREVVAALQAGEPGRDVAIAIEDGIRAEGDRRLLRIALENLLSNAWKFTSRNPDARIAFACQPTDGGPVYTVSDNGAGFDGTRATKLFQPFQRMHGRTAFPGSGVGLATVRRIIDKHGGRIWADAAVDQGASFHFTL